MKRMINGILAFLLVFMVLVAPALAADEDENDYQIVRGGADDALKVDNKDSITKSSDSAMDEIISDDKFLGFDRNDNYEIKDDFSLQEGFDLASSLPLWKVLIAAILILSVLVLLVIGVVLLWNMLKGGKAATNENPMTAAKGIRDAKMVNREYMAQVAEGFGALAFICFFVLLFL